MKFIVLGKYNSTGLAGFIKNPNDNRREAISNMFEKVGAKMGELFLTRGSYDVVVIGEAPDFETMGALKMLVMSSGAIEELNILEETNFNSMGKKAASLEGAYRAPGQ